MVNESEALHEWHEVTPDDDSDEGSSSGLDSGSTEYKSEELTPRLQKKARGEEANDPDFDPSVETQHSHKQPLRIPPDEDTETPWLEVLASMHMLINIAFYVLLQVYS
jgi:hypothetical protein